LILENNPVKVTQTETQMLQADKYETTM